jgi:hypothetical protein
MPLFVSYYTVAIHLVEQGQHVTLNYISVYLEKGQTYAITTWRFIACPSVYHFFQFFQCDRPV